VRDPELLRWGRQRGGRRETEVLRRIKVFKPSGLLGEGLCGDTAGILVFGIFDGKGTEQNLFHSG